MPPQDARATSGPYYNEPEVQHALLLLARDRVQVWLTLVLDAVSEFETAARQHVEQLESNHDAEVDFAGVLSALASAVTTVVPGTKEAVDVLSQGVALIDLLEHGYNAGVATTLAQGKAKLHQSLTALSQSARYALTTALDGYEQRLEEAVNNALTYVDSASTDPAYIRALCDWMGVVEPNRGNSLEPVRQALENQFFGVYESVRAQLLQATGVAGWDDGDMNPNQWEHDAIQRERELYREEGEQAWGDAYKEGGE